MVPIKEKYNQFMPTLLHVTQNCGVTLLSFKEITFSSYFLEPSQDNNKLNAANLTYVSVAGSKHSDDMR